MSFLPSNRIIYDQSDNLWSSLAQNALQQIGDIAPYRGWRVIFAVSDELEAVSLVAAGIEAGLDFGVVERSRLNDELTARLAEQHVTVFDMQSGEVTGGPFENSDLQPGRISVLTSGTTGLPKLIAHTAQSLNTFDRVQNLEPNSWFVPYQVGSYAWYQMVSLGLFVPNQQLVLGRAADLMASFDEALRHAKVNAVSSTPTFWRQAAMSIDPDVFKASEITSISLGGEIVDQAILDYLSAMFPAAKIKHIFASSETGAAIVVSDGRAGFDARILSEGDEDKSVAVRIVEDRLQVRSRYGSSAATGSWIDTGDLVERIGDRIIFRGRADNQMINVGGQKAFPAEIEGVLLSHPDVAWAQVEAKRSPIMGHLPVANLVLKPGVQMAAAEIELNQFCEARLPEYAVPRLWNFLESVPIRSSLKS